jgi:hypothetical protein
MAYPVTLNGQTFTAADFDGQAYVTGLPAIMEQAATHWGTIFSSTSTTSVVVGTGSKSLTVQTNKPYQVGTPLRIANTAAPSTIWMDGVVTAYTAGTGALVVNVVGFAGSGTLTAWSINLGGGGYAVSSPVTIAQGGTGAITASAALTALGAVPLAGGTMTGALVLSGIPTADLHPASKGWIEQRANKDAVRVASTATVTLTAPGTAIDGITLTTGDRVLLKNQSAQAENGIYVFQGSASTMTRATDMDVWADVPNAFTSIEEGTANGNTIWLCQNTATGTLNTTAITWQLVSNLQVGALGAVATTGFVNRTGANTFSTTAGATAATASTVVQRDGSADVTANSYVSAAGSVGTPAYRFSTDTNSGLRSGGADIVAIVANGSDRFSVDGSGVVRITGDVRSESAGKAFQFKPITTHQAGSAGDTSFGVDDGGGVSGMVVTNSHNGSNSSQSVFFRTAQGGVNTATNRLILGYDGMIYFQQVATSTPGYSGNTTTGATIWPLGRFFISQDSFSNWNMNADGVLCAICRSGIVVGGISVNTTSTSFNTSSDHRLKTDLEPLTGALDRLDLLQPKRFRFIADPGMDKVDGFLAHEAADAVPESVTGELDAEDFGGNPEYQQIDQSKLVPLLVAAVQELRAEFNAYKTAHP